MELPADQPTRMAGNPEAIKIASETAQGLPEHGGYPNCPCPRPGEYPRCSTWACDLVKARKGLGPLAKTA